jgi:hypothetical protein
MAFLVAEHGCAVARLEDQSEIVRWLHEIVQERFGVQLEDSTSQVSVNPEKDGSCVVTVRSLKADSSEPLSFHVFRVD